MVVSITILCKMTLSITALIIMIVSKTILCKMALSRTTLSMMILSITALAITMLTYEHDNTKYYETYENKHSALTTLFIETRGITALISMTLSIKAFNRTTLRTMTLIITTFNIMKRHEQQPV
jgi:hypothetical protein